MPPSRMSSGARCRAGPATLAPSADPFAGVEGRARGLRRRRTAASLVGTALAVLVVAGAVPLLTPDRTAAPGPTDVATSAPAPASPYAFDPEQPWPYRGDEAVRRDGLDAWQRAWAEEEPGGELLPLFGRTDEASGRLELVFASRSATRRELLYVVRDSSEAGPRFLRRRRHPG